MRSRTQRPLLRLTSAVQMASGSARQRSLGLWVRTSTRWCPSRSIPAAAIPLLRAGHARSNAASDGEARLTLGASLRFAPRGPQSAVRGDIAQPTGVSRRPSRGDWGRTLQGDRCRRARHHPDMCRTPGTAQAGTTTPTGAPRRIRPAVDVAIPWRPPYDRARASGTRNGRTAAAQLKTLRLTARSPRRR